MKQNKKTLLCVLAALILVCAALALAGREQQNREQEQGTPMIEVHRVDADSITSFTLAGPDETSAFVREADGWVYNGDPLFPLDHDFVNTALETLSRIDAISLLSEDAEDLSPYGLDQPQMQITMAGEDAEFSLRIGNYNSFNGYYYMCEEGVNDVFLIDADLVDLCTATQSDMIRLDRLPDTYGGGEINTVTLTDSQGAQTVYTADSDGFDILSEQLSSLSLDDYADYFLAEEEYAAWGFDNPAIPIRL